MVTMTHDGADGGDNDTVYNDIALSGIAGAVDSGECEWR
jgi:hypothetical protein